EVVEMLIDADGNVAVHAASGEVFRARRIVLAAGPWLPTLLRKTSLGRHSPRLSAFAAQLQPERQVVSWYAPTVGAEEKFAPERHPVWVCTFKGQHYYVRSRLEGTCGCGASKMGKH